jgi:hypothetical protein
MLSVIYAECHIQAFYLSGNMLNVVVLSVIMLILIMLNVVVLSVMALLDVSSYSSIFDSNFKLVSSLVSNNQGPVL